MSEENEYQDFRDRVMKDPYYLNYISLDLLSIMNHRLEAHAKEVGLELPLHKSLKPHVALRIKMISKKGYSARKVASICFPESDLRHGLQMDGRDLKRWAAIVLGEAFLPSALMKHGDYWHE